MAIFGNRRLCGGLVLLFLIAVSCTGTPSLKKPETRPEAPLEGPRVQEPAREPAEASSAAKAHLALARSYLSYRNPELNYPGAYREIKIYLSMAPESVTDDLRNWAAALEEMERLRRRGEDLGKKNAALQRQIEKLQVTQEKLQNNLEKTQETARALREEVAGLKETNNKLKETLEQLKNLDLQMEEKRRIFR